MFCPYIDFSSNKPMSRNIHLTFEEWTAIREEVKPEKWWCYELSARELKEWKSDIEKGYGDERCFERAGVCTNVLNKLTSPYLYNRLLQENYRSGDLMMSDMFIDDDCSDELDEWNEHCLNCFISWATASVDGVDMNTTKEKWTEYNKAMKNVVRNTNKKMIFVRELALMFRSVAVCEVAHCF